MITAYRADDGGLDLRREVGDQSQRGASASKVMGLILSIVLIAAILGGYQLLVRLTFAGRGLAGRLIRWGRISVVVRRAAHDLDREYEELLLR